jgi:hypothetical protein
MTRSEGRIRLSASWGTETVVRCCRLWKTHGYIRFSRCGICRTVPEVVLGMTWEQADEEARTDG